MDDRLRVRANIYTSIFPYSNLALEGGVPDSDLFRAKLPIDLVGLIT